MSNPTKWIANICVQQFEKIFIKTVSTISNYSTGKMTYLAVHWYLCKVWSTLVPLFVHPTFLRLHNFPLHDKDIQTHFSFSLNFSSKEIMTIIENLRNVIIFGSNVQNAKWKIQFLSWKVGKRNPDRNPLPLTSKF